MNPTIPPTKTTFTISDEMPYFTMSSIIVNSLTVYIQQFFKFNLELRIFRFTNPDFFYQYQYHRHFSNNFCIFHVFRDNLDISLSLEFFLPYPNILPHDVL